MSKNQAIQKLLHKSGLCIRKYSPVALSFVASAGVVVTAIAAAKATPRAVALVYADSRKKHDGDPYAYTKKEAFIAAWKCYIPAVAFGASTNIYLFSKLFLSELSAGTQPLDPLPVCFMVEVHFVTSISSFVKNSQRRNEGPRQQGRYARNKQRRKSHGWPYAAIHGFFSAILFCLTAWSGGLPNISRGQCVPGTPLPISAFSISWCLHYPPIPLPRSSPRSQV